MLRLAVIVALVTVAFVVVPGGAALAAKKSRTPVTSGIKALKVSPEELRIRVRALVRPALGIVEEAGDRILRETPDTRVRRGALLWKIETTTTLLSALLRNDPVLAFADAWGYVIQVQNLLHEPEVRRTYGEFADRAAEALEVVQDEFRDLAGSLQEDLTGSVFEARVAEWAADHPIEGALYRRPSMDSTFATVLAAASGKGGAFAALGSLQETTSDVITRMDLYTMYLPRLARWEGELAVIDVTGDVDPAELAAQFERFTKAADRLATVAEGVPSLVERERVTALEAVHDERMATMKDLRGERVAVVDEIRQERIATLQEVEAIARRLVKATSGPLRESVRQEREQLVDAVEQMRERLNDDMGGTLDHVVDHAFLRLLELLLAAAALAGGGVVVYARFLRR